MRQKHFLTQSPLFLSVLFLLSCKASEPDWRYEFPQLKPWKISQKDIQHTQRLLKTHQSLLKVRTHPLIIFKENEQFMNNIKMKDSTRLKKGVHVKTEMLTFVKNFKRPLNYVSLPKNFNWKLIRGSYVEDSLAYERLQFLEFARLCKETNQFREHIDRYTVTQIYHIDGKKAYGARIVVGYNEENNSEIREKELFSFLE